MLSSGDLDFSFSGLKTAVLMLVRKESAQAHADIARAFPAGAEFLCQGAICRRTTPADAPRRGVDPFEEIVLPVEVEPNIGKIDRFTGKISFRGGDRFGD